MRTLALIPFVWLLLLVGCGPDDCVPAPETDATPPQAHLKVTFADWATGRRDSVVLVTPCEEVPPIEAHADSTVTIVYAGVDDEGMKRLQLGLSIYRSVGAGVQMESPKVLPIIAECPKTLLAGKRTFVGRQGKRNITLSVFAENWTGASAVTPTLVVRQRPPGRR